MCGFLCKTWDTAHPSLATHGLQWNVRNKVETEYNVRAAKLASHAHLGRSTEMRCTWHVYSNKWWVCKHNQLCANTNNVAWAKSNVLHQVPCLCINSYSHTTHQRFSLAASTQKISLFSSKINKLMLTQPCGDMVFKSLRNVLRDPPQLPKT